MSKVAVVLFNLGGPDSPAAVLPFLQGNTTALNGRSPGVTITVG